MKIMVAGFIFAVMQVLPGALAQESNPALQLTLSPDHVTVTPDGNLDLVVKWVNESHENIWCNSGLSSNGIDEMYIYDIRTTDGKQVPRLPTREKSNVYPSSNCIVVPGGSVDFYVPGLMRVFDMRRPGVYTVQISLPDWANPGQVRGRSNIVTVTVKAPE